jgi:hypothetical protein
MQFRVFWDVAPCITLKFTDVSEVHTYLRNVVHFNLTTRRYIPEDSKLVSYDLRTGNVQYVFHVQIT